MLRLDIDFTALIAALRGGHLTLVPLAGAPSGFAVSEDRTRVASNRVELVRRGRKLGAVYLRARRSPSGRGPAYAWAACASIPAALGTWKFATEGALFSGDAIEGPFVAAGVSPADAASLQRSLAACVRAMGRAVQDTPPVTALPPVPPSGSRSGGFSAPRWVWGA